MSGPQKVIIDVDVGVDDYFAILLLLNAEKRGDIKIVAIFCSAGNTSLHNVCKNLIRLLQIVNRLDIPVYKGAKESLVPTNEELIYFHGEDGFGDLEHPEEPDLSLIRTIPAPVALRELIATYPNEINYICVGPLTNLALSLKLYDDLLEDIKDIWLMAGNYGEEKAEFNVKADVEAAHIVLESVEKPVFMLTWQTCVKSALSFEWRMKELETGSEALDLLTKAEVKCYDGMGEWLACDGYAVFAFLNPEENILEKETLRLEVVLDGPKRGELVVSDGDKPPNVTVILAIDLELFKKACLDVKNL